MKTQNTFEIAFQISKTVIFEVCYHFVGSNSQPYFSTTAAQFNRPKTDYNICGQAQEELLPIASKARLFWKKWKKFHLKKLTGAQLKDLTKDLDVLKEKYNWYDGKLSFYQNKKLSMLKPKK